MVKVPPLFVFSDESTDLILEEIPCRWLNSDFECVSCGRRTGNKLRRIMLENNYSYNYNTFKIHKVHFSMASGVRNLRFPKCSFCGLKWDIMEEGDHIFIPKDVVRLRIPVRIPE